ncbi:MAG: hypothetical protein ABJF11_03355 [Reichenbachiella sp.]|uniref:hypothetical protein n=1 Tax=Reichenbachiella sp. TaxID=2184521 RepID=UPI003266C22F
MRKILIIALIYPTLFCGIAKSAPLPDLSIPKNISTSDFRIHEHVWVRMKNGNKVEAVILGRHSKNKFWVRKIGHSRQGMVHKKFLEHMNTDNAPSDHTEGIK